MSGQWYRVACQHVRDPCTQHSIWSKAKLETHKTVNNLTGYLVT
jgi:hypothetical protein